MENIAAIFSWIKCNAPAILGLFVFTIIAYALSINKKAINWRTVAWAFGLQLIFAFIVLKTPYGE